MRFHVVCRDSTGSHLFFKPLRYRLGCHLIATLVKRFWLPYTPGLHIPATRWIWICLARNPRTAAAHVPYTVLLTTTPAQVTVSTRGVI
ncbi:TPA: hypothetical protein ACOEEL_000094 [Enterobacter kobei]